MVIKNSYLAVDTFFVMSGFLTTYMFVKQLKKNRNKLSLKMVAMYFIHRFWRLVPLLAATITFYATILPRIRDGPGMVMNREYGNVGPDIELCRKYWWRNLLFIHNFFKEFESVKKGFFMLKSFFLKLNNKNFINISNFNSV